MYLACGSIDLPVTGHPTELARWQRRAHKATSPPSDEVDLVDRLDFVLSDAQKVVDALTEMVGQERGDRS